MSAEDLGSGDVSQAMSQPEEVSKLLKAYNATTLAS